MKKYIIALIISVIFPGVAEAGFFDRQISPPNEIDPNFKIAIIVPNHEKNGFVALYTYDYYQIKLNLKEDCAGDVKAPCIDANKGGAFFAYNIPADGVMAGTMPHEIVESFQLQSFSESAILSTVDLLIDSGEMFKANATGDLFIGSNLEKQNKENKVKNFFGNVVGSKITWFVFLSSLIAYSAYRFLAPKKPKLN